MTSTVTIENLLDTEITWLEEVGAPGWVGLSNGEKCKLKMNDFPEEALYTLAWKGLSLDFDETPPKWVFPDNY
jgi:hypothetical protein